ncbi:Kazal-like serine protease inhibitor domain-containing protein [Phytophthora sojae]|uniref:Kazal-like serine protease inhibitor domain-containing protein n=1 Tax=Phytophthora sojae (strain P6497) TaxID=1094619 RepID=G4Z5W3_PHYSP|nr:Kazal-like serine protease inhibitor domain-containing protein [Phytophthora sojae]EGZ19546.1 Kazal-like serine protease inhibitor domain-containing protein [Phytophthora sojae]|eukprot:XP_009522263.1 Kazal-like serine protease inhibitor domain-containing protein [Phytophthora sojae]
MKFAAIAVLASFVIVGISAEDASSSEEGSTGCGWNVCSENDPQVCGSNGVTYQNQCEVDKDNCLTNHYSKWTVLHEGMCSRAEGGR